MFSQKIQSYSRAANQQSCKSRDQELTEFSWNKTLLPLEQLLLLRLLVATVINIKSFIP